MKNILAGKFKNIKELSDFLNFLKTETNLSFKRIRANFSNLADLSNQDIKDIKVFYSTVESFLIHNNGSLVNGVINRGVALNNKLTKSSNVVIGFQFLTIIDNRTCDNCKKLHGIIFDKKSPILKDYIPPLHIECRCILSPVTIFEKVKINTDKEILALNIPLSEKPNFKGITSLEIFVNFLDEQNLINEFKEIPLNKNPTIFKSILNYFFK